jgi:hypothetical protein
VLQSEDGAICRFFFQKDSNCKGKIVRISECYEGGLITDEIGKQLKLAYKTYP